MENLMKKGIVAGFISLFVLAPAASWATSLGVTPLGYQIGPYATDGYSASWFHSAQGHPAPSDLDLNHDGTHDTLYMSPGSGGKIIAVTGMLGGDWDGTVLSHITGMLNDTMITGGSLGGAYYDADMNPLWYLNLADGGTFYFEKINGLINQIDERHLLLWGQNTAAYLGEDGSCYFDQCTQQTSWGMDLYGTAKSLPVPGTWLLMLLGLAALPLALRRNGRVSCLATGKPAL